MQGQLSDLIESVGTIEGSHHQVGAHNEGEASHSGGHHMRVPLDQGGYYHHHAQGHHDYVDPDERVMGRIKVEAPIFDGHFDPWVFTKWVRDMDRFLNGIICLRTRGSTLLK
jgi:hypothetical protein